MPLITSTTVIRSLSLLHLTISYYLLTSPSTIAKQNLVFVLGEAMHLPQPTPSSFALPTHATAFAATVLAFLSLADLVAVSALQPDMSRAHWSAQAPMRLGFSFVLCGWAYLLKARSGVWGKELKNSLVFSWGFLEMTAWFWVFVLLREERRVAAVEREEKRKLRDQGM